MTLAGLRQAPDIDLRNDRPRVPLSFGNAATLKTGTGLYLAESWEYCVNLLGEIPNARDIAASLWLRSLHGRDNELPLISDKEFESVEAAKFKCKCQTPPVYEASQPRLTAIIQSFNHKSNIANISTALKQSSHVEEIVICEDGSSDGSLAEWSEALPDRSHFIIRSNNLHELRSYNRAMRLSAGDVVLLLQDDDLLPLDDDWIQAALAHFESKPDLGVLGGYIGQLWDPESGTGHEYGEQVSTHGGLRKGNTEPIQYVDPETGSPFMYVECVWIAPIFARRSLLQRVGGLELTLAKRGEPGVWQDCIFSYEAWVSGFKVGVMNAPFERGVGGHGSATSSEKIKQRQLVWERAVAYANRKYDRRRIHGYVVDLNSRSLHKRKLTQLEYS